MSLSIPSSLAVVSDNPLIVIELLSVESPTESLAAFVYRYNLPLTFLANIPRISSSSSPVANLLVMSLITEASVVPVVIVVPLISNV